MSQQKDLAAFLNKMGAAVKFRIEENLGSGYVRLNIEESQRRQAKHDIRCIEDALIELLRNSRDAGAKNIFVASRRREDSRQLWVIDDGRGIPANLFEKIFEARVTSKVETIIEDDYGIHGRGMALFAIKSHCSDAQVLKSTPGKLTSVKISADVNRLPEKHDQSTLPVFKKSAGVLEFTGPKNMPRIAAEFAYKYPQLNIHYGLPSQIAGTLAKLSSISSVFSDFKKAGIANFSENFKNHFGFAISERNSYRAMSSEVSAIHLNSYLNKSSHSSKSPKGLSSLISPDDLKILAENTGKDLKQIAERYNLKVVETKVLKRGKHLNLVLSLEKAEDI